MGLDMYLSKVKVINGATLADVRILDNYFNWKEKGQEYTFNEWCGCNEEDVNMGLVAAYKEEYDKIRYWDFDTEHKYGYHSLYDDVCSWRKANQVHNWFVQNVQDGNDDCKCYFVSREQIEMLVRTCEIVLRNSELIEGEVINGYTYDANKGEVPNIEQGKYIEDATIAEALLPTQQGFFFGSYEYDQWYYEDVKYTYETLSKILKETDFENEMLVYSSSW